MDEKNRQVEELSKANKANQDLIESLQTQLQSQTITQPPVVSNGDATERLSELTR